ncbi:MAG: hypothetical protein KF752_04865 [Pirellulaceae bacterium]|nr:hypothetical protein [Pirellulaceae bacterium]
MNLVGQVVQVTQLSNEDRQRMLALMEMYYEGVCPRAFEEDLADKRWVIQLFDPNTGELCGFSTQTIIDVEVQGQPVRALFSGDTIIDRSRWGDQALAYAWGELALRLVDESPDQELWWFLIASGYKTYRFLPVFFREFYPHYHRPTPEREQAIIDALARHKYAGSYDAARGVIRAQPHHYRLRCGVADMTPERLRDRHIEFFARRNPGHTSGDELCCLARLARDNFTRAAHHVYPINGPAEPSELAASSVAASRSRQNAASE